MNEKDMLYFCKLVEAQSYTLAAKELGVTQPTISSAVRRLAQYYQDPLIIQKNKKSRPALTSAGQILYDKAKELLLELASLDHDVRHANDKKIRISFSGIAGSIYMPEIIEKFYYAGISDMLEPKFERSAAAFSDLEKGDSDIAIYSWIVPFNDPNYFIRTLDKTELVIITGLKHPWFNKTEINARELRNEKFIARKSTYLTRESLDRIGEFGDFAPNIIYTAQTMQLLIDLVERNMGIALVLESSIKHNDLVHVIRLTPDQKLWAYMQIAMRKSFMPNKYQAKGIEILRNFHKKTK